jgi:hypothetical protein
MLLDLVGDFLAMIIETFENILDGVWALWRRWFGAKDDPPMIKDPRLRAEVGTLAQDYFDDVIDFNTFMERLPDEATTTSDEDIVELIDLVEHEPAIGRFFGVSPSEHANYRGRMLDVIEKLKSS